MADNATHCDVCGEQKRDVRLQPSRSQLLFGGFHVTYESRCRDCERDVSRWAIRMIKNS